MALMRESRERERDREIGREIERETDKDTDTWRLGVEGYIMQWIDTVS